ncbi:MAG: histidine kinase [Candidatus Dadabacteria bacterium]|nr:MAG: histidine kinase [Candidatus Dadabacteria bacterium]
MEEAELEVFEADPEEAPRALVCELPEFVLTSVPLTVPTGARRPVVIGWGRTLGVDEWDWVSGDAGAEEVARRVRLHVEYHRACLRERAEAARRTGVLAEAQARLLPRPGSIPGLRFGAVYAPALEAGGDFYDVVRLDHSSYGVLVADAMGHDLGAAYVTGALKAGLHLAVGRTGHPAGVLAALNEAIRPVLVDGGHVTAVFARVDRGRGRVVLAGAGHPPAVLVGADGRAEPVELEGDVLGVHETVEIHEEVREAAPGSRLYLYSDGLLDALRPGLTRREEALADLCRGAAEVAGYPVELGVAELAARAVGGTAPRDDVVLVGVEV